MSRTFKIISGLIFWILLAGSVFIVSADRFHLFELYRKYWTILFGLFYSILLLLFSLNKENVSINLSIESIFKTYVFIGVLEVAYSLLQLLDIIPSYNRFFAYTGSFENPALYAMFLSLCAPATLYLYYSEKNFKQLWFWLYILFASMIIMSESRTGIIATLVVSLYICYSFTEKLQVFLSKRRNQLLIVSLMAITLIALYLFKADSANGRLLIWRVCMDMIAERPLLGFGHGGFLANYMQYQAEYLSAHPDSPFIMLADNISHPFNEFLLVLVNYGVIGLIVLSLLIIFTISQIHKCKQNEQIALKSMLYSILICCCFTYPLNAAFMWITIGFIIAYTVCNRSNSSILYRTILLCFCILIFTVLLVRFPNERRWKITEHQSLVYNTETVLKDYEALHIDLSYNGYFLYNYGAELHHYGYYERSKDVLLECSGLLNDYDVQMLIGECYKHIGDTVSAIKHYTNASYMIPSKFLPSYYSMKLFAETGDTVAALSEAYKIVSKEVKIKEAKNVHKIREEASAMIDNNSY